MDEKTRMYLMKCAQILRGEGCMPSGIFRGLLKEFCGVPYVWGGDSLDGCDCSGSVCCALTFAYGKEIRTTAHILYRQYFTAPPEPRGTEAVFFIDRTGHAVHVAGCAGEDLFMNESSAEYRKCGTLRNERELRAMYPQFTMVRRSLCREAVK